MRYFARKLENHLYYDSREQADNMVSPAGRAAGSAIDSRKDSVRQPGHKLQHELANVVNFTS